MKRVLLYILLPLVAMGCSLREDLSTEDQQGGSISFDIGLPEVTTRGDEMIGSIEDMLDKSVGLYAFITYANGSTEQRALNEELTYNSETGVWGTASGVEISWDFVYTYEKFSFYVYYPYQADAEGINFDMSNNTFSLEYDAETYDGTDVMIGQLRDIVCPNNGVVSLTLNHILSAVAISTSFDDNIDDIELTAKSCYTTGTASLNTITDAVEWTFEESDVKSAGSLGSLGSEEGNYVLVVPQTTAEVGDLYFSFSYNDDTETDTAGQIPAMTFEAGVTYVFKYNVPYYDYDEEEGTLYVDLEVFKTLAQGGKIVWNDYSTIDEVIEQLIEAAGDDEVTITFVGDISDYGNSWSLMSHILSEADDVEHLDLSGVTMASDQKIPDNVFDNNTTLKSIKFPVFTADTQVTSNSSMFTGCTSLEKVEFAEGSTITTLSYAMFIDCTSLTDVNLEVLTELTTIRNDVFYNCTSLEKITVPQKVTSIAYRAFYNCTSLKSINIPASVTSTGTSAFWNCQSLYSYDHDEEEAGFVLEERTATITIGSQSFVETHVRYQDMRGYTNLTSYDKSYFSEE